MRINQMENFDTSIGQFGVSQNVLAVAGVATGMLIFIMNMFIGGIVLLLVAYGFFRWIALPAAEYLVEKIPRNYVFHLIDWVSTMNHLYITNDSNPIPMTLSEQQESVGGRVQRREIVRADPNSF